MRCRRKVTLAIGIAGAMAGGFLALGCSDKDKKYLKLKGNRTYQLRPRQKLAMKLNEIENRLFRLRSESVE